MKKLELKSLDVDVIRFIFINNKVSIAELSNCFEVSEANIRNVLARVEAFVDKYNLGVLLKDGSEYFFKDNYLKFDFNYTRISTNSLEKRERIVYILLKLFFERSINLTKISYELGISRVTLNGDIEFIKNFLNTFKLKLVSIQWKGVFLQGNPLMVEKVTTLFIVKLQLEGYFTSNFKKVVNPLVINLFRSYIDEATENKIIKFSNKIYNYFNIQLGATYYYILKSLIMVSYYRNKENMKFPKLESKSKLKFKETIYEIMSDEEKKLLGDNISLLSYFMIYCTYERFISIYSFNMIDLLKDIFITFNLDKNDTIADEIALSINSIYFQEKFLIPNYYILKEEEKEYIDTDIAKSFMQLLDKYAIPYHKKNIAFLYCCLNNLISESKKKNVLIIDNGSLNWIGKKLKKKIKHLENFNEIDTISYFHFKFSSEKIFLKSKYNIYVFIDLPLERNKYPDKKCFFINSYDFMFNPSEIINLFMNN